MTRRQSPAAGSPTKNGDVQIVCRFDPDTWNQLQTRAAENGHSLAQTVRETVELGLETEKEQGK